MTDLFENCIRITFGMSLLSTLILVSTPFLKKRYTARWRYWAWMLIAIRLLIPVQLPVIQFPDFSEMWEDRVSSFVSAPVQHPVQSAPSRTEKNPVAVSRPESSSKPNVDASLSQPGEEQLEKPMEFWALWKEKIKTFPWLKVGTILWATGAAAMAVIYAVSYLCMRRILKAHMRPVRSGICWEVWEKISGQVGYRGPLRLMRCKAVASPMVCGLWQPVLLLPKEDYPVTVLEMIFRHELVHVMRHDLWYKLLLLAASVVHWFNPIVHWMVRAADRDLEISCDEKVTARKNKAFRAQYSEAIFGVLLQSVGRRFLFSTSFCDEKKTLMQRFSAIFDTDRKHRGVLLMSLVLTACLLAGSLFGCQPSPVKSDGQSQMAPPSSLGSAEELELDEASLAQIHRTASLYETYCVGSERFEDMEIEYLTSLGFGYLLEAGRLQKTDDHSYSIAVDDLAQIDQFFFCKAWEPEDDQEFYHYADEYQTTGEEFFTLEQSQVRQLENGDIAIDYQRKTDKAVLYPVRYVFRPEQVDAVPDILKEDFSMGDTVYKIVSVTNLEIQPHQSQIIEISSAEELLAAAQRINEGGWLNQDDVYLLTADIDLTGVDFIPMGMNERYLGHWDGDDSRDPSKRGFNGVFDGQGHTISHLRLDASQLEYLGDPNYSINGVGLFANIGSSGVVKDLKLEDCQVSSPQIYDVYQGWGATGLLAAQCSGQVQNVSVQGTAEGSYEVGGLVGNMGGLAYNCSVDVTVRGFSSVGAFAGDASYANLKNCTAKGQVISQPLSSADDGGSPTGIGGFIGFSVNGMAEECDVSVYVSTAVPSNWVGAFGGYFQSFEAKNCTYDRQKAGNWEVVDVIYQPSGDSENLDIRAR